MKDDGAWIKLPFVFELGRSFTSQYEVMEYLTDSSTQAEHLQYSGDFSTRTSAYLDSYKESGGQILTRPKQASTSLGMNDAINCYYGFCDDDDIIHPILQVGTTDDGMGRVYSETYDTNQQLLTLTMGVPEYCGVLEYYRKAFDADLAKAVNDGYASSWGKLFGDIVGGAVKLAFYVATWPLQFCGFVVDVLNSLTNRVTKYYDFRETMPMYYRYVDSILVHLAVNLGFYPNNDKIPDFFEGTSVSNTNGEQFSQSYSQIAWSNGDPLSDNDIKNGLPQAFEDGISIFNILQKRDRKLNSLNNGNPYSTIPRSYEDYMSRDSVYGDSNSEGYFDQFKARLISTIQGADKFISFRLDKTTDSSESIGNSTGESSISQFINSKVSAARAIDFSTSQGKTGFTVIDNVADAVKGFVNGALETIDLTNLKDVFLHGSGYLDFPEVWQNSSFSKSYNFQMTFRSPYGDPVSIFYSCYVPLAMLLAAALPRSTGKNSYTSPFLVKAYSKGMFAIPLGIIDSISIRRGADEFGWNRNQLPTVIEVSFTIKDLSPIMHIAATGDASFFQEVLGQNSSFQEYLLTLSGIGYNERLLWRKNIGKRLRSAFEMRRNTWFSPIAYWPQVISDTTLGRLASQITPYSLFTNK